MDIYYPCQFWIAQLFQPKYMVHFLVTYQCQ